MSATAPPDTASGCWPRSRTTWRPDVDFELTDEQRLLRDTVRELARADVAPVAEELDREKRFPYEVVAQMGKLGLVGIPVPAAYGRGRDETPDPIQAVA